MKDKLTRKEFTSVWLKNKNKNLIEPSLIGCDRIEYLHNKQEDFFDHHLMFYLNKNLIFKMWLPNNPKDKPYKDIFEALKRAGVNLIQNELAI